MAATRTGAGLWRRFWSRVLDGARVWGSIEVQPDRFGVTRYRLVVYPPGISESERRRVRLTRAWPLWGAVAWLLSEMWLSGLMEPWLAFVISTAVFLGCGAAAVALGGSTRNQVRTMTAMTMAGFDDPTSVAERDKLESLAEMLLEADKRLQSRQISPIDHEMIWWQVYEQAAQQNRPPLRR
jgi:hypothetical protein